MQRGTFMPEDFNREINEQKIPQNQEPIQKGTVIENNQGNIYQKPESSNDDVTKYIIPNENRYSLIAFILGVFAFFPFVGVLPGIPSIIFGIMGLSYIKKHPGAKGKYHAWVGIIGGIVGIIVTLFFLQSMLSS